MNIRRRTAVAVLGLAALGFTAGACGGSSSSSSSSDQPATSEGLEKSARSFADAVAGQDWGKAYTFLSDECQADKSQSDFEAETKVAMELAKALGMDMSKMTINDVQVRDVDDTSGEVLTIAEIDGETSDEDSWEPWTYQDGSWRTLDCGMSDDPEATDTPVTIG